LVIVFTIKIHKRRAADCASAERSDVFIIILKPEMKYLESKKPMFSRSGEGGEDEMVHFVPGRFLRFLRGRREKIQIFRFADKEQTAGRFLLRSEGLSKPVKHMFFAPSVLRFFVAKI